MIRFAQNLLGWALWANGELDTAKQILEQVIVQKPDLAAAYLNLGRVEYDLKNIETALAALTRANELDGSGSIGQIAASLYNQMAAK